MSRENKRAAAISYVHNWNGELLVVWNKRYGGWTFPGGLVEEGETVEQAQSRELVEETGLYTLTRRLIYRADTPVVVEPHRGNEVYVFRVVTEGSPQEREPGCPVTYFTREEFLKWCPFRAFYEKMFSEFR